MDSLGHLVLVLVLGSCAAVLLFVVGVGSGRWCRLREARRLLRCQKFARYAASLIPGRPFWPCFLERPDMPGAEWSPWRRT